MRIATAMTMAGMPNEDRCPRQPTAAISGAPIRATTTVPTLPPAMWALIAKPRRSGGNCSASRPLPTGCCGDEPMRDSDVRERERHEARREGLGGEAATEQDPAITEQRVATRRGSGRHS